jgi:hypothetical protein
MISSGFEPATFRLITQCLNHLHYHVPLDKLGMRVNPALSTAYRELFSGVPHFESILAAFKDHF